MSIHIHIHCTTSFSAIVSALDPALLSADIWGVDEVEVEADGGDDNCAGAGNSGGKALGMKRS